MHCAVSSQHYFGEILKTSRLNYLSAAKSNSKTGQLKVLRRCWL